ncbi:TonB-dependent receptor [uncultured Pseudoteredinibacter sp.]|uniref:TonB-dependent receptor n=1 Tax=uncultured Pseudoteredinibacter sp. TaxID=1641701 RepID=UPI00260879D9|nr:TonB-dependent receptor [uncultured Pseudoteredinibacter sp.]
MSSLIMHKKYRLSSAISCAIIMGSSAFSNAQDFALEEVVVTAQKRSESVQSIGLTVSALTGDELKEANVDDITKIAANVPNVQVNHGFGPTNFNIRGLGVNEFSSNLDSPIAVHLDEGYISKGFTTSLMLFDIQRVEALKGPQGTLFGRNATGGAVNFFTNKPGDEFEASLQLGYDDYQTVRTEAYINTPLSEGLNFRLSGFSTKQNKGYYDNLTRGDDEGKIDKWALRSQLAWSFDATDVNLSLSYGEDSSSFIPYEGAGIFTPESLAAGSPEFCSEYLNGTVNGGTSNCVRGIDGLNPGDSDPFTSNGGTEHIVNNEAQNALLRIDHDLGWATLTSISSYQDFVRDQQEDADGTPGGGVEIFYYDLVETFSQELRLTSDNDGMWNYVLGFYYLDDEFYQAEYLRILGGTAPGFFSEFNQNSEAVALFAHNDFQLTESLALTLGVRWSEEDVEINGGTDFGTGLVRSLGGRDAPEVIVGTAATSSEVAGGGKRNDENITYKLGAKWEPELDQFDQFMAFVNYSTGFRSGGFNATFVSRQEGFTSLEPEEITAYEGGIKTTFWDGRARLNVSGFIYEFENGIVNVDNANAPLPIAVNAAEIDTKGIEIDGQFLLTEKLELQLGFGWLDSEIVSNITAGGQSLNGNTPVNAPEYTFNGLLRYETELNENWTAAISTDWSWRDDQYLETVNAPSNLQEDYWLHNARITMSSSDGKYEFSLYGHNIADEEYRTYVNDLPTLGWLLNIYGQPRTFGISASVYF